MVKKGENSMNLDNKVTGLLLFIPGAIAFVVCMGVLTSPTTMTTLGTVSSPALEILQEGDNTWAIIGLALAATLAISLPGIAGALGMATTSTAALGAITERPEIYGKTILYVVFIEAIAIYGFVISFLLVGYIPDLLP
jgi:V/A-type H+-transporting ATPase subunit K